MPIGRSLLVALVMLLTACAHNVGSGYRLAESSDRGLAIVSLSFEGLNVDTAPIWRYRRLDDPRPHELPTSWWWEPLDWTAPAGRLIHIALPSGEYEFFDAGFVRARNPAAPYWTKSASGAVINTNTYLSGFNTPVFDPYNAKPFSVRFKIEPGKATYIGNLHLVWLPEERAGEVRRLNHRERDLALVRKRLPNIQDSDIRVAQ